MTKKDETDCKTNNKTHGDKGSSQKYRMTGREGGEESGDIWQSEKRQIMASQTNVAKSCLSSLVLFYSPLIRAMLVLC